MKLDINCVRDVLLVMEDIPRGEALTGSEMRQILDEYSADDVDYTCLKLMEKGFIKAKIKFTPTNFYIIELQDITISGHDFISSIRPQKVWDKILERVGKVGSITLDTLPSIALDVLKSFIGI